jgi:hypothetical protein
MQLRRPTSPCRTRRAIDQVLTHGALIVVLCLAAPRLAGAREPSRPEPADGAQAATVASVTLSPSTIAGGTGDSSTGTVTLTAPAPSGGLVVSLASSNVELAATMPTVMVAPGASTATFVVGTNARYRAYSGLGFTVTISATLGGTTRSASLSVTAGPRPPDFNSGSTAGANTQWDGLMCGGLPPIGGQQGILYSCSPPDETGFGRCTFWQECSQGCRRVPPSGSRFNDFCATSGPNSVSLSRNVAPSGDRIAASIVAEAPAGQGPFREQGSPGVIDPNANATRFPQVGIEFPDGATSVPFEVATSYVPAIQFVDVVGFWFNDAIPPLLITNGRAGHAWLALLPPDPAPAVAIPTLGDFKITGLNPVTGGGTTHGQIDLSGLSRVGGPSITLTSSHPDIVPNRTISAPANQSLFGFQVPLETNAPAADTDVTITASDGRYSFSRVLSVRAAPPPPVFSGISVNPGSVVGGNAATATVTLSAPQSTATVVQVSIIETAPATLPRNDLPCPSFSRCYNVTVPAGATTASFTISTSVVSSQFNLNVFATHAGTNQQALLLITPGGSVAAQSLTISPVDITGGTSTTGTVRLSAAAPSGGAVVTLSKAFSNGSSGTVPVTIPASVTVPSGQTAASFTIASSSVTSTTHVRVSASYGGATVNADMTLFPALGQVSFPGNIPGGTPATGTVLLGAAAPSGGALVTLSSANPSVLSVPASVTVSAGQTTATFTANSAPVAATTGVVVSASYAGTTVSTTAFVVVSRAVSSVTLTPSTVAGGTSSTATVTLRAAAPTGNAVVSLASSNTAAATVPNSLSVPAGQSSATFTVNTAQVLSTTMVVISATYENVTQSAVLTINPPAGGGGGGGADGFLAPASQLREGGGDGNGFESGPANAFAQDGAVATDVNSGSGTSTSCTSTSKDRHRFYDFGLTVPAGSAVTGIEVRLVARADSTSGSPRMCAQLSWDGGVSWTAAKATGTLGTSLAAFTLGGAADTWGRGWTAANLANTAFRLRIVSVASSTSRDFFLDAVAVRAHAGTPPAATLNALSLNPQSITGGSSSTGTVTLTGAAPAGGAVVALASSNANVAPVPASVTVAAGSTTATFTTTTAAVTGSTPVTLSATYSGTTRTAALTVNPQGATGTAALTVTATGRSGERITSSPAGINVSVGSTGSASFTAGTSITLSVSNGRDAVWSGACSSGGNKRRSCTFTLNADASVSANVQ